MTVQANTSESPLSRRLRYGRRILRLLLCYVLIWFVLTGAGSASWIIGVPAVLLAVAVSLFLAPPSIAAVNPAAALLFVPYFIVLSIMSGVDVLRRTFSPVPRINPGILTYRTALTGSPRILLANIISLLPGTLSADLVEQEIRIHVLDTDIPVRTNIRDLENRLARIFRQPDVPGEQA